MIRYLILVSFFIGLNSIEIFSQTFFQKMYDNAAADDRPHVAELSNGDYIVFSKYLKRLNSAGDTIWTMNNGCGYCLVQDGGITNDSNLYVFGYTLAHGSGGYDFYLSKVDFNGNVLWSKAYGTNKYEGPFDVEETADSGFIMVGMRQNSIGNYGYIIKTDKNGDIQWTKTINGLHSPASYDNAFITVKTLSNYDYAIGGYTWDFGTNPQKSFLLRLDSAGNIKWSKVYYYNIDANENISGITETPDNGLIFIANSYILGSRVYLVVIKTDFFGNVEWNKIISNGYLNASCEGNVIKSYDNGYVIGGAIRDSITGFDFFILKMDTLGTVEWSKAYGDTASQGLIDFIQTIDGGLIFVGDVTISNYVDKPMLVKTDASGNSCMQINPSIIVSDTIITVLSDSIEIDTAGTMVPFTLPNTIGNFQYMYSICSNVGIQNIEDVDLNIYPNPSLDHINIDGLSELNKINISLFDVYGHLVDLKNIQSTNTNTLSIDVSNLTYGVYFIVVNTPSKIYRSKFVKD